MKVTVKTKKFGTIELEEGMVLKSSKGIKYNLLIVLLGRKLCWMDFHSGRFNPVDFSYDSLDPYIEEYDIIQIGYPNGPHSDLDEKKGDTIVYPKAPRKLTFQDFKDFLGEDDLALFIANTMKSLGLSDVEYYHNPLRTLFAKAEEPIGKVMSSAFVWSRTPQGQDYWCKLHLAFQDYIQTNHIEEVDLDTF